MREQLPWVGNASGGDRYRSASAEQKRQVRREQVSGLFAVTQHAYRTSLIFAVLGVLHFWGRVPAWAVLSWFAVVASAACARFLLARWFFRTDPEVKHLDRWLRLLLASTLFQSLAWVSMLGLVWHSAAAVDVAFAVFMLCALAFGGFAALGFLLPAYLTFALPIIVALPVWLFSLGGIQAVWLLLTVATGFLMIVDSSIRSNRIVRDALLLSDEHESLIRRLTEEKEQAEVTLRSIGDGVITTDTQGLITYVNPVAEKLTGWDNGEARHRRLSEVLRLLDERSGEHMQDLVNQCLHAQDSLVLEEETQLLDRSGERESQVEVTISPIRGHDREIMGTVVVVHDVTELRGLARVMTYQENHDPLTGLVNRREFVLRLWHALETARSDRLDHAMAYLDLDQFKLINDTCGHVAGDELLKQVAEKFKERVRDHDTLARLGGDEFGLLFTGCDLAQAQEVVTEFCNDVRDMRFNWDGKTFIVGVSIGLVPVDGSSTPTDLLAAADAACYVAKDQGRNRVHIVHPQDRELAHRHGQMQWTTRIQQALDEQLFRLRVQRIQPLDPKAPVMAEFLLNITGVHGELISPGAFLPAAERFNMMPAIDRQVIAMVFARIAGQETDPQLQGISVFTINVSGQSFSDETFLAYVLDELAASGVDPTRVCFEITETAVIDNMTRAKRFIQTLGERGCQFALDDFGSGLSSFGYLRSLPVEYLKIDGMFVKNMTEDPVDRSMVESINQVGHVMGIRTIAEFVEDEATMEALRELGVDYGQGYALHRPELLKTDTAVPIIDNA